MSRENGRQQTVNSRSVLVTAVEDQERIRLPKEIFLVQFVSAELQHHRLLRRRKERKTLDDLRSQENYKNKSGKKKKERLSLTCLSVYVWEVSASKFQLNKHQHHRRKNSDCFYSPTFYQAMNTRTFSLRIIHQKNSSFSWWLKFDGMTLFCNIKTKQKISTN